MAGDIADINLNAGNTAVAAGPMATEFAPVGEALVRVELILSYLIEPLTTVLLSCRSRSSASNLTCIAGLK